LPPSRDEDDDALQMNESDIFKAMNQLQHDDSMPQETRDLINQGGREGGREEERAVNELWEGSFAWWDR